jgi:hypothetical protein
MYDISNYREAGRVVLTGLASDDQVSVFIDWNLYDKPLLLAFGSRVVTISPDLKRIIGANSLNLTYGKDNSYNLSVQTNLINNLHAYASGRFVSTEMVSEAYIPMFFHPLFFISHF